MELVLVGVFLVVKQLQQVWEQDWELDLEQVYALYVFAV